MKIPSNIMDKVNKNMKVLLPKGSYELNIENVEFGTTQNGDGQRVIIDFKVVNNKEYDGCVLQVIYTISTNNAEKRPAEEKFQKLFSELLTSAKITPQQRNSKDGFDTDLLIGKVARAEVEVLENSQTNQIQKYY